MTNEMNTVELIMAGIDAEERAAEQTTWFNGYRVADLHAVFDLIKDQNDWKNPISTLVREKDFAIASVAVEFFTATKLKIRGTSVAHVLWVEADGYRNGPCGDR